MHKVSLSNHTNLNSRISLLVFSQIPGQISLKVEIELLKPSLKKRISYNKSIVVQKLLKLKMQSKIEKLEDRVFVLEKQLEHVMAKLNKCVVTESVSPIFESDHKSNTAIENIDLAREKVVSPNSIDFFNSQIAQSDDDCKFELIINDSGYISDYASDDEKTNYRKGSTNSEEKESHPYDEENNATICNDEPFDEDVTQLPCFSLTAAKAAKHLKHMVEEQNLIINSLELYAQYVFECVVDTNGDLTYFYKNNTFWFNDRVENFRRDLNCKHLFNIVHHAYLNYLQKKDMRKGLFTNSFLQKMAELKPTQFQEILVRHYEDVCIL